MSILKELSVYLLPSIVTSFGYYIALKKQKEETLSKIVEIERKSEWKIQEIKTQMSEQAKLYQSNSITDLIATTLKGAMQDKKIRNEMVEIIRPQLKQISFTMNNDDNII